MRYLAIWLMLAVCAGCTTKTIMMVHKTGSTRSERQIALDECRITSFKEIPQTMVSSEIGGYSNPGSLQCTTFGASTNCQRVGAVNIPSSTVTNDVNQGLRERFIARCLSTKGFSVFSKPVCSSAADKNRYRSEWNNQPPAASIKCASGDRL